MQRLLAAVVGAVSLVTSAGAVTLAGPGDAGEKRIYAELRSGRDFPCERYE